MLHLSPRAWGREKGGLLIEERGTRLDDSTRKYPKVCLRARPRYVARSCSRGTSREGAASPIHLAGLVLILSPVILAGCATQPPATKPAARALYQEANDPLEPTNRLLYRLSNAVTSATLTPAARAYRRAVPEQVRSSVANFFANLGNPIRLVNDMLQGNPRHAGDTFMRFVINTTIGVGGIFDVARGWGYPPHPADFGMTFAVWGAPPGPYLFIPLLGPSDLRDALGTGVSAAPIAPLIPSIGSGATKTAVHWTTLTTATVSGYSQNLPSIDEVKRTALDPYATFRSLFWQHRAAEIKAAEQRTPGTVPIWFYLRPKTGQ